MEPFEPPKYITSLIAAINDGAKAAQTGALAFSAVGLYLVATALATTDEDLLLDHTTSIAQLGVQAPPVFSLAIAPLLFVVLHAFTLIRYDMLAVNLRRFCADLQAMVVLSEDRERCRQLLTNVEFVIAGAAPRGSPLRSRIFGWAWFALVVAFPVILLIIVQISTIRLQNQTVNWTQRGGLTIDLLLLIWMFARRRFARDKNSELKPPLHLLRGWFAVLWAPTAIIALNFLWLTPLERRTASKTPLDLSCEKFGWGCRFLTVDHRTVVGRVWKQDAVAILRSGSRNESTASALAGIEGAYLRERALYKARLDESRLYGADLIGAQLVSANLVNADLRGATLMRADLTDADLTGATLAGAILAGATLAGATLTHADLTGARLSTPVDVSGLPLFEPPSMADLTPTNFSRAKLAFANLTAADLTGANLAAAGLYGANLAVANLTGANLTGTTLIHANLTGANLTNIVHTDGANLSSANLEGANLTGAALSGITFTDANLTGVDLHNARLYRLDLSKSKIRQLDLDWACGDGVRLPPDLTIRSCH